MFPNTALETIRSRSSPTDHTLLKMLLPTRQILAVVGLAQLAAVAVADGGFASTCSIDGFDGRWLQATCPNEGGSPQGATIDLGGCLANSGGSLVPRLG